MTSRLVRALLLVSSYALSSRRYFPDATHLSVCTQGNKTVQRRLLPRIPIPRTRVNSASPRPDRGRCARGSIAHTVGYYVSYVQASQARGPSVHKKNPGRMRMGEPEPTRASISHGCTT